MLITPQIINFIQEIPSEVQFLIYVSFGIFVLADSIANRCENRRLRNRLEKREEKIVNTAVTRLYNRFARVIEKNNLSSTVEEFVQNTNANIEALSETVSSNTNRISNTGETISDLTVRITNMELNLAVFMKTVLATLPVPNPASASTENIAVNNGWNSLKKSGSLSRKTTDIVLKNAPCLVVKFLYDFDILDLSFLQAEEELVLKNCSTNPDKTALRAFLRDISEKLRNTPEEIDEKEEDN